MKRLNWLCSNGDLDYMRKRQVENIIRSDVNPNENWMAEKLRNAGFKFNRQTIWGLRLFDFWNHHLGVAIEVDGPEHRADYDAYRDEYNFRRSAIVVLRVRNRNEDDAARAVQLLSVFTTHAERRQLIRIGGSTKWLVKQPYPPSFLQKFLSDGFEQFAQYVDKFGH